MRWARCSWRCACLGEQSVEVDVVLADAIERWHELRSHANALSAPIREEEKRCCCAEVDFNVVWIVRWFAKKIGRRSDVRQGGTQKSVLTAEFGDQDGVVGRQVRWKRCIQLGDGSCRGFGLVGELLEGGESDGVTVDGVERKRPLCGGSGCAELREKDCLTLSKEGERVRGLDELEVANGLARRLGGEIGVGNGLEHFPGGDEGDGGIVKMQARVDQVGIGLGQAGKISEC